MKEIEKVVVVLLVTLVLVGSLVACGGGGGGGGGITPIAYTGNASQATIDDSNAPDFAAIAENGVLVVESSPAPVVASVTGGSSNGVKIPVPVIQTIFDLGNKTSQYFERLKVNSGSVAAYSETVPYDCSISGSLAESFYINEASFDFSMTLNYFGCDEGVGEVLNGGVTLSGNFNSIDSTLGPVTFNMGINNLEIYYIGLDKTITTYAVVTMTEDKSPDNIYYPNPYHNMLISDLIIADSTNIMTSKISNYNLTMVDYSSTLGYQEISINNQGSMARVYHIDHGYVDFYTEEPIHDDGTGPSQGIIYMVGANNISARIDFNLSCPNGTLYYTDTDSKIINSDFCY